MQLALDQMARQGLELIEVSEQVAGPTESDLETEEETLFFGLTPHRRLATTRPPPTFPSNGSRFPRGTYQD